MAARAATASRVENKLRKAAKQSEMRALRKGMNEGRSQAALPSLRPSPASAGGKTTEKGLRKMAAHRLCLTAAVH